MEHPTFFKPERCQSVVGYEKLAVLSPYLMSEVWGRLRRCFDQIEALDDATRSTHVVKNSYILSRYLSGY